jgi:hypothetical protein
MFGCRPLGPVGWTQAVTAIGLSIVGSRFIPDMQEWTKKTSERVIEGVQVWLAEEDDDELTELFDDQSEATDSFGLSKLPQLPGWAISKGQDVVQSVRSWITDSLSHYTSGKEEKESAGETDNKVKALS